MKNEKAKNSWTAENVMALVQEQSLSVREKIANGSYHNPDPCPQKKDFSDKEEWLAARRAWQQKGSDLCKTFKYDVLVELGLVNHPKAELLIELAWDYGDKNLQQVLDTAEEMSDLLR